MVFITCRVVFAVAVGVGLLGCSTNPAGPSADRYRQPRLEIICQPSGERIACTATLDDVPSFLDTRTVTQSADWSVVPPDVGTFSEPGVLIPRRPGEAEIHARSEGVDASFSPTFLIGPGQPALWLYFVQVAVNERDNTTSIAGALVEMLDGYQRGTTCTTNMFGVCTIDRVLTGETFDARISKPGYAPTTVSYRVDSPVGLGNPPFLTVSLARAGQ